MQHTPRSDSQASVDVSFRVSELETGRVHRYEVLRGGEPLAWQGFLDALIQGGDAPLALSRAIVAAPFNEVFFETPPLTTATVNNDAEFVLVSAGLHSEADSSAFSEHLSSDDQELTKTFTNLRGDATLVVPTDMADDARRNYLRSFLRSAPEMQIRSFWAQAAMAIQGRMSDVPVWVSTSGGGVPWLHLRLDDRPKYYAYRPYRTAPVG